MKRGALAAILFVMPILARTPLAAQTATPEATPTPRPLRPTVPPATKVSGILECGKPDRTSLKVGDMPDHVLAIGQASCKWTKSITIGKLRLAKGESTAMRDDRGEIALERGYHVGTTSKGDTYSFRYDGQSRARGNAPGEVQGRWAFTGGTGGLEGLQGAGTYKGTVAPNGAATIEMEGEYRFREPPAPGRTP